MAKLQTLVTACVEGREVYRTILPPGNYVIGSGATADLRFQNSSISASHARLKIGAHAVEVDDLSGDHQKTLASSVFDAGRPTPNDLSVQVGDLTLHIRFNAPLDAWFDPDTADEPDSDAGEIADRYVIGEVLAEGAMGVIRRAREVATGREVAMKQMSAILENRDPSLAARFVQEAKITAHLEHPNVVPVHDVSPGTGGPRFYTMKMVRGVSLEKVIALLRREDVETLENYSLEALLTIFQKICDALAFAHSKGVIHRDLKPANIMVGDYGEVLAMDWGVAKLLSEAADPLLPDFEKSAAVPGGDPFATMAGTVMGTPWYMAPEQARGEVESVDFRSDVYALGAILYELLMLEKPVAGSDPRVALENACEGRIVPPLQRIGPQRLRSLPGGKLPTALVAVAMKAMSADPERRYQRVEDLQADVRAFQTGHATAAEAAGPWRQTALLIQRHRALAIAIAASLLALAVLSIAYTASVLRERNRANAEKDRARQALAEASVERNRVTAALAQVEPERQRAERERDRARAENQAAKEAVAQISVEKKLAADALARVEPERQRAEAERARAEAGTKNTMSALAKLRATAPTFLAQAQTLIENQNAPEALEKLDFAIAVDPGNPAWLLRRAHLLEAMLRLQQAAEAYRRVLSLHEDASAAENLALCEKLLQQDADPAKLSPQNRDLLYQSLLAQQRQLDSLIFARLTGRTDVPIAAIFGARITAWQKLPEWGAVPERFGQREGGYFMNLSGLPITDLQPLAGLPIQELNISETSVTDLAPIHDLPLRTLIAVKTPLTNLGPLHGMRLTDLNIDSTRVTDLSPLAGVPLTSISMWETNVVNLAPLAGAALKSFKAGHSNADSELSDISPLKGMPLSYVCIKGAAVSDLSPIDNPHLTTLEFGHSTIPPGVQTLDALKVSPLSQRLDAELAFTLINIDALRGKPLTQVILTSCYRLRDLSPLADCPTITELHLPGGIAPATPWGASVATLRKLPNLRAVAFYFDRLMPAADFWRTYDGLNLP